MKKELREYVKKKKKLNRKSYPANYYLMTARALWQVHYQFPSLQEFIKLNVYASLIIKNAKHPESNSKIESGKMFSLKKYFLLSIT